MLLIVASMLMKIIICFGALLSLYSLFFLKKLLIILNNLVRSDHSNSVLCFLNSDVHGCIWLLLGILCYSMLFIPLLC